MPSTNHALDAALDRIRCVICITCSQRSDLSQQWQLRPPRPCERSCSIMLGIPSLLATLFDDLEADAPKADEVRDRICKHCGISAGGSGGCCSMRLAGHCALSAYMPKVLDVLSGLADSALVEDHAPS